MKPYLPRPNADGGPYVIAHRGISGRAPENTASAFKLALQNSGIAMIELDVRTSREGEVIVLHDRTLQRTTTGNGAARNYSLSELKQFDAGSWFHSSFSEERIPTLAEILRLVRGRMWVNIELKGDFFLRDPEAFAQAVVQTVRREQMEEFVLYSSFTHDLLARVKRMDPHAKTGVIYNIYRDFGRLPNKLARRVGASVFVCAKHELRRSMIRDARQHDIALYVYTLNSIQDARRITKLGVDGIISDTADEIVKALDPRL